MPALDEQLTSVRARAAAAAAILSPVLRWDFMGAFLSLGAGPTVLGRRVYAFAPGAEAAGRARRA